jgi:amino acid adenylation domain-containing protein
LAVAQERFWFLHELDPGSSANNLAVALRLEGPFRSDLYQLAWNEILRRHEVLRTRFRVNDGRPVQIVDPPEPADVEHVDLRDQPADQREGLAVAGASAAADRPFDLSARPPHRLMVFRLEDDIHLIVGVFHHIVCDLWSLGIISSELAQMYAALVENCSPALRRLPFQYGDYAVCHRRWVNSPALAGQLAFWRKRLRGLELRELPADRPRQRRPGAGATGAIDLPPDLLPAVRALAAREGVTPFVVLIAAFLHVLGRYTGTTDVGVGTPVANRAGLNARGLIGTFVNTLVFRADLAGADTFRDLLARTRDTANGAFANQDVPFHRLVHEVRAERASSDSPLFQVLFNLQNAPVRLPRFPGLHLQHVTLPRTTSQFDLNVWVDIDVLKQVGYSYDTSLFDGATIERLVARYLAMLEVVVHHPERRLAEVDLLSSRERRTLLHDFNQTRVPFPPETVIDLFVRQARCTPDATAVEVAGVGTSYRDLLARAEAIGNELRSRGAGMGSVVGICLHRSVDLVAALLGVLRSGAAYLPLDPAFPRERLAFMTRDAGAAFVLTEPSLAGLLPDSANRLFVSAIVAPTLRSAPRPGSFEVPATEDLAYVIYTSGSTGRPKGVEIPHRSLTNLLRSMAALPGLQAHDRLLSVTTVSFDIAALEIFLPLVTGATIVLASRDETRDASRLAKLIDRARVTVMQATPATWRMLVDAGWPGRPSLKILCGGEALPRDLAEQLLTRARSVWNLFGPTETTIWSTAERVQSGDGPVSIGRPIANTQVYVLDPDGCPVPIGLPGELYIGGDGVARGYRGQPDLTAKRFVPDPFGVTPGARLYRTGDRVRFSADGRLEWLGRLDDQLKVRGYRVELAEVESRLLGMPGITNGAVVARHDDRGETQLAAFVAAEDAASVNPRAVRDYLASGLPSYMVPAYVEILDSLPMTPNGKVDRAALPRRSAWTAESSADTPASNTERQLCDIWAKLLHIRRVGVGDDFFDLGGDSLLAVRLVSAIEREIGGSLSVATLLEARTVRQLAEVVDRQREASYWKSLVIMQRDGHRPPFFCVHGVGGEVLGYKDLAARMGTDRPFVAIQAIDERRSVDPARGIASQAAAYVEEVRRFQPIGPYHIGGYSHGGRVALEMALQLEACGEDVAFLGILDTAPVRRHYSSPGYWLRVLRSTPRWFWHDALRTPWSENLDRLRRAARMVARSLGFNKGSGEAVAWYADVRDTLDIDGLPDTFRARYEWDFRAFCSYTPAALCGPVTVFRAAAQPLLASHEPDLGWSAVSRGPVDVVTIPGTHTSILAEPDVTHLAKALREALERSAARQSMPLSCPESLGMR